MNAESHYYQRDSSFIQDRLDENYNNPIFDKIQHMIKRAKYNVIGLGDKRYLLFISSGKTPSNIHYSDEGIPFIGANNLYYGKVDIETCPKIKPDIHNTILKSSQIRKDNILISIAGTIGLSAVYDKDEECNCNQAVAILKLNSDVNPAFISKYLSSELGQLIFSKLQHISSQPNINTTEIGKINVILPPRKTQDDIIAKLKPYGDKVIELEKEITIFEDKISKSVPLYFGYEKIENEYYFNSGDYSTTFMFLPFDKIQDRLHFSYNHPNERILNDFTRKYSLTTLGDIILDSIVRGEQPEYSEEGVTVIKTIDLKNGSIDYNSKVSKEFFEQHSQSHITKNDILIASTGIGSIGKVDVYESDEPAMVDGHISIVRLKQGYNPHFIAFYLRSLLGKIQFDKYWTGSSGQIEIQPYDLEKFIVPDNSIKGVGEKEQQEIVSKINDQLSELKKVRKEYEKNLMEQNDVLLKSLLN